MTARAPALALAVLAAGGGLAVADDSASDPEAAARAAERAARDAAKAEKKAKEAEKKAKQAEKRRTGDTIDVHGRLFTRAQAFSESSPTGVAAPWQSDLGVESARLSVDYQWREQLRAQVEYEAAKNGLRDAFVQLELGSGLRLQAGRFKLPIGTVEQTSAWTLPTIERGMTADILDDGILVTGRRSAVALRWRGEGAGRPSFEIAAAQLVRVADGDRDGLVRDGGNLAVVARAEVRPCAMYTFAIAGSNRAVDYVTGVERYWTGSLEAEVDLADAGHGLRLWGDAMIGESHLAFRDGAPRTTFAAGHLIAGYRLGGADRNKPYVEPYVGGGWFNPRIDRKRDDVSELVVGLGGGRWKRWRAHAQVAYQNAKSARPVQLLGDRDVNDRITVTAQLEAAF